MYKFPNKDSWTGRIDGNLPESLRIHQKIECIELNKLDENYQNSIAIIGFECDEGVKRNKGIIGAAKAPNEIRKYAGGLPYHFNNSVKLIDVGNIACSTDQLETSQQQLGSSIEQLYKNSIFPIILGGGHETFYGHYLGARAYLGNQAKIGMINIDAHFDMRNDPIPSSGTMFKQILDEDPNAGYLVLGIQPFGNTEELFQRAKNYNCTYLLQEEVEEFEETFQVIDEFSQNYDYLILTLCFDSIISHAAPGVSAPSPFGLEPKTVRKLLKYIALKEKLISFDISEVNPKLDIQGRTARLAANLLAETILTITEKKNVSV